MYYYLKTDQYYHFRSTLKRDDFFAYVYFSNVTVSQTSVSSGPMKMRCFGRETNKVCQTTVACFVHVAGRFSSFRLYFSSYNLLIGWQVLGFQILSRITQMAPVQIKVVYDYYSAKRTTPFFITEEELLNLDFHSFKSRLLLEVPHIAKSTSAKVLRQNDNRFWPFSLFMSSRSRFNAEFKSTLRFFFFFAFYLFNSTFGPV